MILIFLIFLPLIILCYIIDKFINVKNVLASVQQPKIFQSSTIITPGGEPIPSNVSYLPPSHPNPTNNVYIILSGNPGSNNFYLDFLNEIHQHTQGKVHAYAIGHAYHTPLINLEMYDRYNQLCLESQQQQQSTMSKNNNTNTNNQQSESKINDSIQEQSQQSQPSQLQLKPITEFELPRFDSQRIPIQPSNFMKSEEYKNKDHVGKYILQPFPENFEQLDLRQQIAHKISIICQIRKLHPQNDTKFIISGHSMGSYCWLEVMRTIERCYVYKHFGENGLILWDLKQSLLCVEDVENEHIPIQLPTNSPHAVATLDNKISQVLFSPEELALWMDDLTMHCTIPEPFQFKPTSTSPSTTEITPTTTPTTTDESTTNESTTNQSITTTPIEKSTTKTQDNLDDEYNELFLQHITTNVEKYALETILQFHGLMPTIMRIADTPNGHQLTPWFFRPNIVNIFVKIITNIPSSMKRVLFNIPAPFFKYPDVHTAIRLFFNYHSVTAVVKLATAEMCEIRSLDINLVQRHATKLWLYMSDQDEWAPTYQREYFQKLNQYWETNGKKTFHVQVDNEGARHAFCFGGNAILAKHSMKYALQHHPNYI